MKNIFSSRAGMSNNSGKVSLQERRRFLGLGLRITGVFLGGGLLSLVPAERAQSELLETSVIGTFPYQPHYAMLIYKDRCIDRERCLDACAQTNNVPSYGYRITILNRKKNIAAASKMIREFLPVLCNQCNRPPCVRVCPTKATYKDKTNGIVMINDSLCIGCRACMTACPYNARYYDRNSKSVDKCDFCFLRRLQNGEAKPACVEVCPAEAMFFGDLSDQNGEVYKRLHAPGQTILVLRPESGAMPNVFYINGLEG
jgi:Fe-S-cluster-containing dehydrogenase component